MSALQDLDNADEIAALVRAFYARVRTDELLGPVFNDQAHVDWDEHIPRLTAFWCKIELGIPGFIGAPTQKHSALSSTIPFAAKQFGRWVALFHETVDEGWCGPHAESIKANSVRIARAQSLAVIRAEPWAGPSRPPGLVREER
ncbi:MAG: group III truncated hemoglobin [Planctomycetota bacterium]